MVLHVPNERSATELYPCLHVAMMTSVLRPNGGIKMQPWHSDKALLAQHTQDLLLMV